jgi:hypothetical protein
VETRREKEEKRKSFSGFFLSVNTDDWGKKQERQTCKLIIERSMTRRRKSFCEWENEKCLSHPVGWKIAHANGCREEESCAERDSCIRVDPVDKHSAFVQCSSMNKFKFNFREKISSRIPARDKSIGKVIDLEKKPRRRRRNFPRSRFAASGCSE